MKASELRELGIDELKKKEKELRSELLLARFAKTNQQLKNPLKVRSLRRNIAKVLTVLNEKGDE
ncbi:MAG: 50S ribosomal protein L29 [bacterium]|nr:50S ribosomal protein L29 [Candidatus Margulisiibacteriota bacterium]